MGWWKRNAEDETEKVSTLFAALVVFAVLIYLGICFVVVKGR